MINELSFSTGDVINLLLERDNLIPDSLFDLFDSPNRALEALNGDVKLSDEEKSRLAKKFDVSPNIF